MLISLLFVWGDSFTEGVGASRGKDYPAVLDRLVKAEFGNDYQVINLGQSGKNTTQIKDEFILYLNENTPEVVVIMAGSANYWNYYGFEDRNQFIYNIRTFKLIKLLWNEVFSEKSESTPIEMSDVFSEADYQQNRKYFQEKLSSNNLSPTLDSSSFFNDREIIYYSILSKNSQDLCKEFRDSLTTADEELMKIYDFLNGNLVSSNDLSSGYYKAVYYLLQSGQCGSFFKEMFLNLSIREFPYIEDVYYNLLKLKCRVPLLPKDFDTKRICINDTIAYYNLKFGFSTAQENIGQVYIEESTELEIENGKINRWVEEDLEEVIVACQKKGIKLIIMSYPYKYENPVFDPVNSVLKGLAQKYKIIFVDNYSNFSNLTSQRNSYFVADGHCSDIGYEFIANEVFSVIKSEKLLNQSEIK
jgi:lysophospholipase L1-like esterase